MFAFVVVCGLLGQGGDSGTAASEAVVVRAPEVPTGEISDGTVVRVGGDLEVQVEVVGEGFKSGKLEIDTPLPVGYPSPTPPGAIDLKRYPSVRRAEVSGEGSTDSGQNSGFWPLFRHIKKRDIAMTAPVEMELREWEGGSHEPPTEWTMAFLYRSADLGPTGSDGRVVVRDADPVTVIAIGLSGSYKQKRFDIALERLEEWLVSNPGWVRAGEARWLGYNNPSWFHDEWSEVQIPIEPAPPAPQDTGAPEAPAPANP